MWCIENFKSAGMWAPRRGGDGWGNQAGLPKEGGPELNLKEKRGLCQTPVFSSLVLRSTCCILNALLRGAVYTAGQQTSLSRIRDLFCWDSKINSSLSSSGPLCLCSISVKCPSCEAPSYPLQFSSGKIFFGKVPFDPSHPPGGHTLNEWRSESGCDMWASGTLYF